MNRRCVPLYFDLSAQGAAADADARAFVLAAKPALGAQLVAPPNVLLMTPDGKIVAEIDPFAKPEKFLAKLLEVLSANSEFSQPSAAERALSDPVARARMALELWDLSGAQKLLAEVKGAEARYWAGHVARLRGDFEQMESEFSKLDSPERVVDVQVERAQAAWARRDLEAVDRWTKDVSALSARSTEALYLRGLALFHTGAEADALAAWSQSVREHEQDAWVYRADWAYTETKSGAGSVLMRSNAARDSLLGRIGYMGRRNPDLVRPKKR